MPTRPSSEPPRACSVNLTALRMIKVLDQEARRRMILRVVAIRQWQFGPILECSSRRWPVRPLAFFAN